MANTILILGIRSGIFLLAVLFQPSLIQAQQPNREHIAALLERDRCVTLDEKRVEICKANYLSDGNSLEATSFRPLGAGKHAGILLTHVPFTLGMILAQQGFACLLVEQPGFGKSEGKRDFVGPQTIKALITGFRRFAREPYVDAKRMGIFGYSRGAMAAALMTLRLGKHVRAAVFGAGAYDFQAAYDEVKVESIRRNMEIETGMTAKAIKERSSIRQMERLKSPVLILHSEQDENVPVSQALALRNRLTELEKDFEIKISSKGKHGFMDGDFLANVSDFFNRHLKSGLTR